MNQSLKAAVYGHSSSDVAIRMNFNPKAVLKRLRWWVMAAISSGWDLVRYTSLVCDLCSIRKR